MFGLIFSFLLLLITTPAYANFIVSQIFYWPVFYITVVFTVGFLLEYICICILIRARTSKLYWEAVWCTLIMNLASTFVGAIFRIPFAILYVTFFARMRDVLTFSSGMFGNILYVAGIYFMYVCINTIIEAPITMEFFPKIARKRVWFWVFIANCLSMGVIGIILGIMQYYNL